MRLRRHLPWLVGACLILTAVVLDSSSDARPGGGRSYSAPSRSSSRSSPSRSSSYRSSSSSSGGYRSSTPRYSSSSSGSSRTVVVLPVSTGSSYGGGSGYSRSGPSIGMIVGITLAVAIVVIALVVVLSRSKKERAKITVDTGLQQRAILALQKQDPGFNQGAFVERTRATMAKVNEAWLSGSMVPARRLISDGVFIRFQTQLALLKADGLKNWMADWSVVSADILAAEADDNYDSIHMKVVGKARDLEVPFATPKEEADRKAKSAPLEEYHEVWSFIRRRGQKSKDGVPALEGRCPSCGADMPLSESVRCEFCKAVANSGEHDWVLAEITQPEEWMPGAVVDKIPGFSALKLKDPTVSRQELEDKASVIFWKWIEAKVTGKLDNLARYSLGKPEPGRLELAKVKLREVAVGSSEVVKVEAGQPGVEGSIDQVLIEIRWSASVEGRPPEGMIHVFVLQRPASLQSKRGLASLDCPNCAGPLPESDAAFCSYCGEAFTGGKQEWALSTVLTGEYDPDFDGEDEDEE